MDLNALKEPTPVEEIKFRVGRVNAKGKASMLAYVDARYVMDRLDKIVGPDNWKDNYSEVKGNLYCGISIKINDEWITKWDCGVESNIEQQKGEASDSFKRSAVKWGIGRDLYNMGNFEADAIKTKAGKWWVNPQWKPKYDSEGKPWDIKDMKLETPPHQRKKVKIGG